MEAWVERDNLGEVCNGPDGPVCGPEFMSQFDHYRYAPVRGWLHVEDWSGWSIAPPSYRNTHHNFADQFSAEFEIGTAQLDRAALALGLSIWVLDVADADGGVVFEETPLSTSYDPTGP